MANNDMGEKLQSIAENTKKNLEYAQSILETLPADQEKTYEQLKKLLQDNLEYSKTIYLQVKRIQRWIFWQRIFGFLKWLIILVPIILGIIYLPVLSDLFANLRNNIEILRQSQEVIQQLR